MVWRSCSVEVARRALRPSARRDSLRRREGRDGFVVFSAVYGGMTPCRWCGDAAMKASSGSWFWWCGSVWCQLVGSRQSRAVALRHLGAFTNQKSLHCAGASSALAFTPVTASTIRFNFTGAAICHHELQDMHIRTREYLRCGVRSRPTLFLTYTYYCLS